MSETKESVRDTLEAVIDAAVETPSRSREQTRTESRTPRDTSDSTAEPVSDSRGKARPPPAEREGEPDSTTLVPPDGDRPRDQFGRFLSKTSEAREEAPDQEPTPTNAEPPSPDQPELKTEEPETPAIAPPQAWSAAAKSQWNQLPRAIQEEVLKRESDVDRGFQQRAQQINVLEPIAQAIQPYAQKFALAGVSPGTAVQQLLAVQDLLDRNPVEGVAYVAHRYGVDLRQFATAYQQAQQPQNPEVQAVQQQISELRNLLARRDQAATQMEESRINSEVEAFRADTTAHPYFDAVRPAMGQLMETGLVRTLQDAYDHACWAIPEVRQRILADQDRAAQAQRTKADKEAAERARRAAVSVTGAPGGGVAQPSAGKPGKNSIRSDIEAALAAVASS